MAFVATNRKPISRYIPPQTARNAPPIPPRWLPEEIWAARPPLAEFVLLSMLLHALAIALFGAPSGGSREGRAMWGSLEVVLPSANREVAPVLKYERQLQPLPPPMAAPTPAPLAEPPRIEPQVTKPAEPQVAAPPPPAPARVAKPKTKPVEVPFVFPPLLDRLTPPPELKLDKTPVLQVPPPTQIQAIPPPPREEAPPLHPAPVEVPPALPSVSAPAAPATVAPPIEVAVPRVERIQAEPIAPLTAPLLQPIQPTPTIEAPPMPAVPITRPVEQAPVEVQPMPVPPIEKVVPKVEPAATPVERAPTLEVPAAPKLPTALERALEQPRPRESTLPSPQPAPKGEGEPQGLPSPRPAPKAEGERPSRDQPARPYDPTAPSIDLDAVKKRAAEMARQGTGQRAILPFPMPPVPQKKSKMEQAIENARKPDCKTAYQDLGLAAIVPLIANEFGEGNCRW